VRLDYIFGKKGGRDDSRPLFSCMESFRFPYKGPVDRQNLMIEDTLDAVRCIDASA